MLARDIGIDLGTANVLIYIKGRGIVLNEPSVVAVEIETKKVIAVGKEANEMLGRTPGKVKVVKPMKDGVIADFELTEIMLNEFINKVKARKLFTRPRVLICCPTNITPVEKNAIIEAAERTGARKVYLEEEPKVAAIGAGMDISKPVANMVLDIGGGTTDIAILSLNGIKTKREVKGRNLITGLPSIIEINQEEVKEALMESLTKIIKSTKKVLEETSPELSADIVEKGVILTGGGALLNGLMDLLEEELTIPVLIAETPLTCVAEGTGILLNNIKLLEDNQQ